MKIYTITIQHTYVVEAEDKQEALDSICPSEYTDEKIIEIEWYEPKVI